MLDQVCPECGFDTSTVDLPDVGDMIRSNATEWQRVLARPDVRARPEPDIWSALEYGCHVRDVLRLYLVRLELMLDQDGPHYPNWDQDETAVTDRYDLTSPAAVAAELTVAAAALADRFDSVTDDEAGRTGFRSDGASFTVASFARYLVHDPIHHLWDVRPR